jgi:hypothetical protein
MTALRKRFLGELCDTYDAERRLLQAFPKMAEPTQNRDLKSRFQGVIQSRPNLVGGSSPPVNPVMASTIFRLMIMVL